MESFVLWILQSMALCLLGCQRRERALFSRQRAVLLETRIQGVGWIGDPLTRRRWFHRKGCTSLACLCPTLPSPGPVPPEHLSHLFPMVLRHIYFTLSLSNYVGLLPLFDLSALFLHIISRQARRQRLRPSPIPSSPYPVSTVTCTTPYAHLAHQNRTPKR